jgi:shikimate kinase
MISQCNIILTGYMGSGKSTMGKKLAQLLRRDFVDLDKYIEQQSKLSVTAIFNQQGEEAFRVLESACLREVLSNYSHAVIALGGGTVCFSENLALVKQHGLLVYLQLPPKVLAERIGKSKTKRPLLQRLNAEDMLTAIEKNLALRNKYYTQAHLTVNGINLTAQLLQHNIIEFQKTAYK